MGPVWENLCSEFYWIIALPSLLGIEFVCVYRRQLCFVGGLHVPKILLRQTLPDKLDLYRTWSVLRHYRKYHSLEGGWSIIHEAEQMHLVHSNLQRTQREAMPRDAPETAMDSEVHVQLLNFYIISRFKKETTLCPFVISNGNKFSVVPCSASFQLATSTIL